MDTGTTSLRIDETTVIQVETPAGAREEDIAHRIPAFDGFTEALSKIATSVRAGLDRVQPSRATVEFGLDVSMESGQATALIVKGTGSAHVTVTLEWDLR
ncbi:hypothetical protein COUCH_18720 [Couchioplanes caeruleus]|uniref:CU044_2847 family protein n=1 Tax=Couchioplanes caeruleus TaxID=56438 RepID=UPI0020BFADD2|nr:CU044_2847 family protein [Couchioplanes caeruleus]UQU68187.1 hypothetical protein COUCH_18720 [Couchioplanes caeruleus]